MAENDDHSDLSMIAITTSLLLLLHEVYFGSGGYLTEVLMCLNYG